MRQNDFDFILMPPRGLHEHISFPLSRVLDKYLNAREGLVPTSQVREKILLHCFELDDTKSVF